MPAPAATAEPAPRRALARPRPTLSRLEWLRYGPFLAQVVVTRRCNLSCTYCSEFDQVSPPVPTPELEARFSALARLRTWALTLTGGEPTLHPDLPHLIACLRDLGFRRRMMITNGYRLTEERIESWNEAGLTDLQISVDGVVPNEATKKVLDALRPKLELLARHARFQVVMSGVIGSAPPGEALEVVDYAQRAGFQPRVLLIHDEHGHLDLDAEERAAFEAITQRIGKPAREAHDYRARMITEGAAPFRCRSGSRYLYVDEFGDVHWCSQQRGVFKKPLSEYDLAELRAQFHAAKGCNPSCTVGCARTASAYDEWRSQAGVSSAAGS